LSPLALLLSLVLTEQFILTPLSSPPSFCFVVSDVIAMVDQCVCRHR
jgi:hypothetical protein